MTPDLPTLQSLAASNYWPALAPEIVLGVFALLLLAVELLVPRRVLATVVPRVAILGLFVSLAWTLRDWTPRWLNREIFGGLVRQTTDSQIMRVFFLGFWPKALTTPLNETLGTIYPAVEAAVKVVAAQQ